MERVMTYNIHGAVGTDRKYDPDRVVRVIREVSPTILGLQEVRRNAGDPRGVLDVIQEKLPDHGVLFLKTLVDQRGSYGNALVTPHEVLDHVDLSLDGGGTTRDGRQTEPRRAEARRAIIARLNTPGGPIRVIVTHLAVERWARPAQAEILLEAIDAHTDRRREPAILMGDLNEWRRPNAFLRRLDRLFSRHVARRTFPSRIPIIPLDRIWLTDHLQRDRVWAHRSRTARRASDHLPLCLECHLPA